VFDLWVRIMAGFMTSAIVILGVIALVRSCRVMVLRTDPVDTVNI